MRLVRLATGTGIQRRNELCAHGPKPPHPVLSRRRSEVYPGGFLCQAGKVVSQNIKYLPFATARDTSLSRFTLQFNRDPSTCDFRRGFGRPRRNKTDMKKDTAIVLSCLEHGYFAY